MNTLWMLSEIVTAVAAMFFLVLGLSGSLYAFGFARSGPFRRYRWRAEHRTTLRWLAPVVLVLSVAVLVSQVRALWASYPLPNKAGVGKGGIPSLLHIGRTRLTLPGRERQPWR
jgi:hypothetical protein